MRHKQIVAQANHISCLLGALAVVILLAKAAPEILLIKYADALQHVGPDVHTEPDCRHQLGAAPQADLSNELPVPVDVRRNRIILEPCRYAADRAVVGEWAYYGGRVILIRTCAQPLQKPLGHDRIAVQQQYVASA